MVTQQIRRMFGFPAGHEDTGDDGDGDGDDGVGDLDFIREYDLTDVDWTDKFERIYIDPDDKAKLVNYGLLEQQLQASTFDQMTLSRHGAVLLSGPPGTGKTTLAKGAANELAKHLDRDSLGVEEVIFKQIEVRHLFSSDHGDSPKLVEQAFDSVIADSEEGDVYQIVLLDEVESLFSNRGDLTDTDPMDAIRAVNTALDSLDSLAEVDNVYVISTSNQPGSVDSAYMDRTDEQIYVGNPSPENRAKILEDIFEHLEETFGAELSPTDGQMDRLVDMSAGFSGRRMRKSVLSALARNQNTVRDPGTISVDHLLEEFAHKQKMLASQDNDYITLGETPEGAPSSDGHADGVAADDETRRASPPDRGQADESAGAKADESAGAKADESAGAKADEEVGTKADESAERTSPRSGGDD